MPVVEYPNPLMAIAALVALLALYYLLSFIFRLKKLKLAGAMGRLLTFSIFALFSFSLAIIVFGTFGYNALTKEEVAAEITVYPIGVKTFHTRIVFPDGREQVFSLRGDELMIDAYILKWKPWANLLGLHTGYRLDRVSGRYVDLQEEKASERTVYAINDAGSMGIAKWRNDYAALGVLLDVEHGSASFAKAGEKKQYQLMVTTDGLLLRPLSLSE